MSARSSQPRNIQGMHGPRRYAPVPKTANHNTVFTAKEVLSFVQLNGLIKAVKTDTVTDGDIESILMPSGLTRTQIECRMVEAAFEALAPDLPKIPPDNIVRILEFSKANKLAVAYKIDNEVSWTKLKNSLNAKRVEILEVYGTFLVPRGNVAKDAVDQMQAIGHGQSTTSDHMTSRAKSSAVHCYQPPKHRAPIPNTTSSTAHRLNSTGARKVACGQWPRRTNSEVGLTKTSCYVTMRRKKGTGRQEVKLKVPKDVANTDLVTSERESGLAQCLLENNSTVRTDEPKSFPIPEEGKDGHRKGGASGQSGNGFGKHERASIHSDVLDALQLVQSPEVCEEPEKLRFFDDDDDWTDNTPPPEQPDLPDENSSTSGPKESSTTRTLRILAEWCNQIDEDKRTGVWQEKQKQKQQRDFMNSPDPDFSFSEACRSPQQIDQCMFAFRGLRIDVPAVPGKPSRHDRPVWYVREDAGSPTPMGLGRHRSNVTFRRKPAS